LTGFSKTGLFSKILGKTRPLLPLDPHNPLGKPPNHPQLRTMGVAAVFNPGSAIDDIVAKVKELSAQHASVPLAELRAQYFATARSA